MHEPRAQKTSLPWRTVAAWLLACVIAVTAAVLAFQVAEYRNSGELQIRQHPLSPQPVDVEELQDWMTFNYLNRVFLLPPDHLQKELGITDRRYPRISIKRYATEAHITPAVALEKTKAAIRAYEAQVPGL